MLEYGAREVGNVTLRNIVVNLGVGFYLCTGASSPLQLHERERMTRLWGDRTANGQNGASTSGEEHINEDVTRSAVLDAELGSFLHRTFQRACTRSVELLDAWPCLPVNVLATHMADRLETPYEVPMTMEQYEEVSRDRSICSTIPSIYIYLDFFKLL
jgi:hypothetical protein